MFVVSVTPTAAASGWFGRNSLKVLMRVDFPDPDLPVMPMLIGVSLSVSGTYRCKDKTKEK